MNCVRALTDIAHSGVSNSTTRTPRLTLVRDDVYLPSDVAARLLPPDGYHDGERVIWGATGPDGDRPPLDH